MSVFTFLVTVETERDSGLIASRDEQSEIIVGEIESAAENASISSIGARGDSEYSVVSVDIEELEKKELKAINAEYDREVAAAQPTESDLSKEVKQLRKALAEAESQRDRAQAKVEELTAKREEGATRIWSADGHGDKRYIQENYLFFQMDAGNDRETVRMQITQEGIEVMFNGWRELLVRPNSSNVIILKAGER